MNVLTFHTGFLLTVCGVLMTCAALLTMRQEINRGRSQGERVSWLGLGAGNWPSMLRDYRSGGGSQALVSLFKAGIAVTVVGLACAALSSNATPAK